MPPRANIDVRQLCFAVGSRVFVEHKNSCATMLSNEPHVGTKGFYEVVFDDGREDLFVHGALEHAAQQPAPKSRKGRGGGKSRW